MSKQIRIDDLTLERLKTIARRSNKTQSAIASQMLNVFGRLIERMGPDDRILIEDEKQKIREIDILSSLGIEPDPNVLNSK